MENNYAMKDVDVEEDEDFPLEYVEFELKHAKVLKNILLTKF
jgi:hypothetical protein